MWIYLYFHVMNVIEQKKKFTEKSQRQKLSQVWIGGEKCQCSSEQLQVSTPRTRFDRSHQQKRPTRSFAEKGLTRPLIQPLLCFTPAPPRQGVTPPPPMDVYPTFEIRAPAHLSTSGPVLARLKHWPQICHFTLRRSFIIVEQNGAKSRKVLTSFQPPHTLPFHTEETTQSHCQNRLLWKRTPMHSISPLLSERHFVESENRRSFPPLPSVSKDKPCFVLFQQEKNNIYFHVCYGRLNHSSHLSRSSVFCSGNVIFRPSVAFCPV